MIWYKGYMPYANADFVKVSTIYKEDQDPEIHARCKSIHRRVSYPMVKTKAA